jgi:hypothetical protein
MQSRLLQARIEMSIRDVHMRGRSSRIIRSTTPLDPPPESNDVLYLDPGTYNHCQIAHLFSHIMGAMTCPGCGFGGIGKASLDWEDLLWILLLHYPRRCHRCRLKFRDWFWRV